MLKRNSPVLYIYCTLGVKHVGLLVGVTRDGHRLGNIQNPPEFGFSCASTSSRGETGVSQPAPVSRSDSTIKGKLLPMRVLPRWVLVLRQSESRRRLSFFFAIKLVLFVTLPITNNVINIWTSGR